jgi:hypothetical protein
MFYYLCSYFFIPSRHYSLFMVVVPVVVVGLWYVFL